jgi:inosine/xanthosine triphosphate pyrophosphatase family protein
MAYFITGNKNKFNEAKTIISNIEQLDIDLPEITRKEKNKIIVRKIAFTKLNEFLNKS